MGLSTQCLAFASIYFLSLIVLFHLVVANSWQSFTPTYHDDENSALLQFKQSFVIDESASDDKGAYPKISSWQSNSSCCSWDGVECDEKTGHVNGLDLSSSCLYGSFTSNNTLFSLVHLERLNLADNDFNSSQIPPTIRNFPRLRYLNLSFSVFSGHVPSEISQLSMLSSLDLSQNDDMFSSEELLRSLAQNLTGLETLDLSDINISSTVPNTLANLSRLTSLNLYSCGMSGKFSEIIFELKNLKFLDVSGNPDLTGYFPVHHASSLDLLSLKLSYTNFVINLSSLIERFHSLKELALSSCNISEGPIPYSLGNLRHLVYLDLSYNKFNGQIPASFANLSNLTSLILVNCSLSGKFRERIFELKNLKVLNVGYNFALTGYFPDDGNGSSPDLESLRLSNTSFFINLPYLIERFPSLEELVLRSCNISEGPIPFSLGNLRDLISLDLSYNKFNGQIPPSLFNLMNLQSLRLDHNNLTGTVEFQKFLKLQKLTVLYLSSNNLEVLMESRSLNNATTAVPKFEFLSLGWCNITEFPNFLRSQDSLTYLDLSGNKLQGPVPKWMWNTSTQTLRYINISYNMLSSFEKPPAVLPWVDLQTLDLSFNELRGPLLIPSASIRYYAISDNKLTGQVPPLICNLTSLIYLDLSNNKLIGDLPHCEANFSVHLGYLKLGNNSFHGNLPETYTNGGSLLMLDISRNNFHGQLPRSLVNCASLESLVLSHNKLTGSFPVWLGVLPELKLLKMDHNVFYGVIVKPNKTNLHFPMLRILDLSYNYFSGQFPFEYIFSGNGTTSISHELEYYYTELYFGKHYSIIIMNKGVERYYSKVPHDLIVIDISSNSFERKIPEFIGKLKGIWSLNVSNNNFSGSIPSSLSNLTRLESLDLSHNNFSGEIPQQLAKLDFLTTFNVSYNNLTGPVPRGNHFTTFDSTSYQENPGLCGDLLLTKCGNSETPGVPPPREEENDSGFGGIESCWKFVLAGVVSGLVVGVVLADVAITRWPELFSLIVGMAIKQMKRRRVTIVGRWN